VLGFRTAAPFPCLFLGGTGSSKSPAGEWEAQHPAGNTAQVVQLATRYQHTDVLEESTGRKRVWV